MPTSHSLISYNTLRTSPLPRNFLLSVIPEIMSAPYTYTTTSQYVPQPQEYSAPQTYIPQQGYPPPPPPPPPPAQYGQQSSYKHSYYQPTPLPQTVIAQPQPQQKRDDAFCWGW
ncbi:hypothetical protein BC936DRAFT_146158 [Jimgerdemannia flammicorona]|uniref:Uncharacterized protein n=1 Tax=Jimgerdemannia flammicorona TaxID=994334 RepID=A0A433D882_9FUNG|nr:hypothetical protein BC936DRAFT_146158 [Jimgerdemannia flammicorona]